MTSTAFDWSRMVCQSPGIMAHPGLPPGWVEMILLSMGLLLSWFALRRPGPEPHRHLKLHTLPMLGPVLQKATRSPWPLVALRLLSAGLFLLVIYAGLFGTPLPERNLATMLTWTLWWTGLILSLFFVGTAWCAVCPWDALAGWLVKRRLWRRGSQLASLNLKPPRLMRSVWPALWLFVGLTWLELGVGVTTSPYATALLALFIVVLATASMALFERKAFCRYACPVGRTIGAYSQLSPVALRPIDPEVCARCQTLECYHGTEEVEPCPTHLVMGRLQQNTYCTSCGDCSLSCPDGNVGWQLRPSGEEAISTVRPHADEGWFSLGLVALTSFHGITMMPFWHQWMSGLARLIGDSGQLLWSFSIGMAVALLLPVLLFLALARLSHRLAKQAVDFRRLFSALALATLPLAFAYHLAHNLNHLARESRGFLSVLSNPLGTDTQPLSQYEMQFRHLYPLLPQGLIFALQALLILFGFWMSLRILRRRGLDLLPAGSRYRVVLTPVTLFLVLVTLFNLWLLMQPMVMRM